MSKNKFHINRKTVLVAAGIVGLLVLATGAGVGLQLLMRSLIPPVVEPDPLPQVVQEVQNLNLEGKGAEADKKVAEDLLKPNISNDEKYQLYILQGNSLADKGDFNAAVQSYLKAYEIKQNYQSATKVGGAYEGIRDKAKAIEYYRKAMELLPKDYPVYETEIERYELMINNLEQQP